MERAQTDAAARAWVGGYITAWKSNDEADISTLFDMNAEYRFEPWTPPARGVEEIVTEWLKRRDEAGSFTFQWDIAGIDGDRAFVQAETVYADDAARGAGRRYSNLWVIDFTEEGRAIAFTEWFMDQSDPSTSPD